MRRRSIIIFDVKKDYAHLPSQLGGHWRYFGAHDSLHVGLNSPGIPHTIWVNMLCTLFTARAGLKFAWTGLANILQWLVAIMNPSPGEHVLYPDFRLIREVAERSPSELWSGKGEYMRSLINELNAFHQVTDVFHCFSGLDLERDIISKGLSAVIDVSNLTPVARAFLVELLISQVLYYRLYHHVKMDTTQAIFVIDESDTLIGRAHDRLFADGLSPLGLGLSQGREFGIMFIIVARLMGQASRYVLNSPQYHVCLTQADEEGAVEGRRTLGLPPGGGEQMLMSLQPGECIIRQSQSCWPHAMRGRIDYVEPYRGKPPACDSHEYEPSRGLDELPPVRDALKKRIAEHKQAKSRQKAEFDPGLPSYADKLLRESQRHPYVPVARLWDKIGTPAPKTQSKARQELEDRKLAAFGETRVERKNCLLIEIQEEGYAFLNAPPLKHVGRGGIAHRHMSFWIQEVGKIRKCQRSVLEWVVPGESNHPCDAAWLVDGRWHVFEVHVNSSSADLINHCKSCLLDSDVESVTVVACTRSKLAELKKRIHGADELTTVLNKIHFQSAKTFMDELEDTW